MGDKATRKMDADEFRALMEREGTRVRGARAETVPASNEVMDALVAQTRPDPDDDLAIPVEEPPPKPQAVSVSDRPGMRHGGGIAPITKPPPMRSELPPAPRSRSELVVNLIILAVVTAIVIWLFI